MNTIREYIVTAPWWHLLLPMVLFLPIWLGAALARKLRRRRWRKAGRLVLPDRLPCHAWPALVPLAIAQVRRDGSIGPDWAAVAGMGVGAIVAATGVVVLTTTAFLLRGLYRRCVNGQVSVHLATGEKGEDPEPPRPVRKREAWEVHSAPDEHLPNILHLQIWNAPEECRHPIFGGPRVALERGKDYFRVTSLYVPAACRRMRMGSRLIVEILDLTKNSALPVYVDAAPFGDGALDQETLMRFYERLGFKRVPGHAYAMVQYSTRAAHLAEVRKVVSRGHPDADGYMEWLASRPDEEVARIAHAARATEDPFSEAPGADEAAAMPISGADQQRILGACIAAVRGISDLLTASDNGLSDEDRADCIMGARKQCEMLQRTLQGLKRRQVPRPNQECALCAAGIKVDYVESPLGWWFTEQSSLPPGYFHSYETGGHLIHVRCPSSYQPEFVPAAANLSTPVMEEAA